MQMKIIGAEFFSELEKQAAAAPRKRAHHNLHQSLDEAIHRLCIAADPATYIRPHRHARAGGWELLVILKGAADVLVFDNDGVLKARVELSAAGATRAIEIDENTFHGFIPQAQGSIVLEVKQGPYVPTPEKDFAPWAPAEGSADAARFLAKIRPARPGCKV